MNIIEKMLAESPFTIQTVVRKSKSQNVGYPYNKESGSGKNQRNKPEKQEQFGLNSTEVQSSIKVIHNFDSTETIFNQAQFQRTLLGI